MQTNITHLLNSALRLAEDPRVAETLRMHGHDFDATLAAHIKTRIHPDDQMLLYSLHALADPGLAVSQYFGVALQQHFVNMQLLRLAFPERSKESLRLLDFACGFGRTLRLTVAAVPAQQVWAAEIQSKAVAFVAQEFGAHGLQSTAEPAAFQPKESFDFIWVASLFSHLPESLFHEWLSRLLSLLSPDGVLCFSVHDESILPAGIERPAGGIYYSTQSENTDLDGEIYGTTHVSEAFVRGAVERVSGFDHPYLRLPRALANQQDVYVVARNAERNRLPNRNAFRRGPWGWVDCVRAHGPRKAFVSGWAWAFDRGDRIERIEVVVGGSVHVARLGVVREDLVGAFGDATYLNAGWEIVFPLSFDGKEEFVTVAAYSCLGESALIYCGLLDAVSLRATDPWGYLETAKVLPEAGGLRLTGWAASADGTPIDEVVVTLAGTVFRCRPSVRREDVSAVLGDERYAQSGWEIDVPLEPSGTWVPLQVMVQLAGGSVRPLFVGRVDPVSGALSL